MEILTELQPSLVFKYFEEISKIPRGSGDEKRISDYLVSFGKSLGLETYQDEALNVIIKKPASKGYENAPTVIIQGHMDMVCEKNKGTEHDFTKDPLKLRIDGDFVYATGTTLGADNGIAMAYGMAILADDNIMHPALELLLTTDEETGMKGAMTLTREHVNGEVLLNLDSEVEGELLVSCAGGERIQTTINVEKEAKKDSDASLEVKIRGLKGGHSGMEIHKGRGNSNKLMGRLLKALKDKFEIKLVHLEGGSKNNAIPREADVIFTVKKEDLENVKALIKEFEGIFKHELKVSDPSVTLEVTEAKNVTENFTLKATSEVIDVLYLYPNGINSMSMSMDGLVESSTNLGVVTTTEDSVVFDSAVRSSVKSLKDEITNRARALTELVSGEFIVTSSYPEWEYDSDSKIRGLCVDVYEKMNGKKPEIVAIHAGVECGLFNERLGNLDMISFGPNLYDVHTPNEHMSIKSVQNVWEYLLEVLKNIK
ncbi:aminoacyl-histidine dipeptidase [Clostridium sp. LY3-2]|uniref:aminoacyl-histidine dipeptidase n=2 Tax=Clostridium TaxID=1485 RepID=UPI0021522C37|nr:aminoacyl-histidine dipeptidase [Clostridium sp. LY3-2]MCR6514206.1 aminoacyl-histidine dipeptidase [Clostridium sp. LY3-2]